eukprot:scaffold43812_cov39-Tisochrysis_lutea.AAC.1
MGNGSWGGWDGGWGMGMGMGMGGSPLSIGRLCACRSAAFYPSAIRTEDRQIEIESAHPRWEIRIYPV